MNANSKELWRGISARAHRFTQENGEVPTCVGHYLPADPECDGSPPCTWRGACRVYQQLCRQRKVDPEVEKKLIAPRVLTKMIFDAMHRMTPVGGTARDWRQREAWTRFKGAFQDRSGIQIQPHHDFAVRGEPYEKCWTRHGKDIRVISVRCHSQVLTIPMIRFFTGFRRLLEPTIEFRAGLKEVLAFHPLAVKMARRWRPGAWNFIGDKYKRATAVRVFPERIEDMARLAVLLLEAGLMHDLALQDGAISYSGIWVKKPPEVIEKIRQGTIRSYARGRRCRRGFVQTGRPRDREPEPTP